jgi:hypothetical protein
MVRERGYLGSARTLRLLVAKVRPRPKRAAFLLVETLPGEVAQVDCASGLGIRRQGACRRRRACTMDVCRGAGTFACNVGRVCHRLDRAFVVSLTCPVFGRVWWCTKTLAI